MQVLRDISFVVLVTDQSTPEGFDGVDVADGVEECRVWCAYFHVVEVDDGESHPVIDEVAWVTGHVEHFGADFGDLVDGYTCKGAWADSGMWGVKFGLCC